MARDGRETDVRGGGMRLWARFALWTSLALTLVMALAGFFLWQTSTNLANNVQESTLSAASLLSAQAAQVESEMERTTLELNTLKSVERGLSGGSAEAGLADLRTRIESLEAKRAGLAPSFWEQSGSNAVQLEGGSVLRTPVTYGTDKRPGTLYRVGADDAKPFNLLVPASRRPPDRALLGLIIGTVILVILVGAAVSAWVASQVSGPLEEIVEDIRHISTGDLKHRTRGHGAGELSTLARAIDRMTKNLADARENELALSIRDRELEVAAEVREALLPQTTPEMSGFEVGALHVSSSQLWGDFHDFVEVSDGGRRRVGLLVCDVSGKGLPGALVGATARSYLRSALSHSFDVKAALFEVNRELARDVKRGMYVSALYALVDPLAGVATVVCAGHKIPLIRFSASDGKVRLVQPEGIALAFDKGPIFEGRLEIAQVPLDPGDRLVLVNTGAVEVRNAEGRELGEKPLYAQVMKLGALPTATFLVRMRAALEGFAGEAERPRDISVVTVARPLRS